MKSFATIASALCASAFLAGCAGNEGGDSSNLIAPEEIEGAVFITGLVVDEEFFPVVGATVAAEGVQATAETDESGEFQLGPVGPGEYVVIAEKIGYERDNVVVLVTEGKDPPPVTITLAAILPDLPYHHTELYVTFVYCASRNLIGGTPCTKLVDYVAGTNVSGEEKFAFTFIVPNPGLADVLIEMYWTPQQFGKEMLFMIQTPPNQPLTAATVKYFAMEGAAPLRGWVVAGIANGENRGVFDAEPKKVEYEGLTVWSSDNSTIPYTSLYLNHRTETWMTFFYNRAGPREFTAVPER